MFDQARDLAGISRPRCRYCNDVIGIYEPYYVLYDDGPRQTSLAAEPELLDGQLPCAHLACFAQAAASAA